MPIDLIKKLLENLERTLGKHLANLIVGIVLSVVALYYLLVTFLGDSKENRALYFNANFSSCTKLVKATSRIGLRIRDTKFIPSEMTDELWNIYFSDVILFETSELKSSKDRLFLDIKAYANDLQLQDDNHKGENDRWDYDRAKAEVALTSIELVNSGCANTLQPSIWKTLTNGLGFY